MGLSDARSYASMTSLVKRTDLDLKISVALLITMVIGCKFKKNLLNLLTLYTSFHDLIKVYSRGQNFDVNRNLLSLRSFATSFKNISLRSDFTQFFFRNFIHIYSHGAGADNPFGTKFWCQQEHVVTSVVCCKFKKNLFEVWFYTIFFMILYMYIAPGQGQTPGDKVFMSTEMSCHFIHLLQVSKKLLLMSDFIQFISWCNTCIQPPPPLHRHKSWYRCAGGPPQSHPINVYWSMEKVYL